MPKITIEVSADTASLLEDLARRCSEADSERAGATTHGATTGERVRRGSITKAGNRRARRALIEGAWAYRFPARISSHLQERLNGLPKGIQDIGWKAHTRLCGRYRRLMAKGKRRTVVVTAIAREMSAFLWAIGQQVAPHRLG